MRLPRILPPYLFVLLVVISVSTGLLVPVHRWTDRSVVLAGILLVLAGLGLSTAGSRKFAVVGTNILPFEDPTVLVTTGLFSRTRNPMYLGFLLALFGTTVAVGSPVALLAPLVFFLAADRYYIPFEEGRMHAVFGPAYGDYARRVRRWI